MESCAQKVYPTAMANLWRRGLHAVIQHSTDAPGLVTRPERALCVVLLDLYGDNKNLFQQHLRQHSYVPKKLPVMYVPYCSPPKLLHAAY